METIKSFLINHDAHPEGIYLSHEENNVYTYDLRFKKPNVGDFLTTAAAHSVEHMFATVIRNSDIRDKVVYFGPMGCRTGFYLLLLDTPYEKAVPIILDCMEKSLLLDEVPGSARQECGNYLDHDIEGAKAEMRAFLDKMKAKA